MLLVHRSDVIMVVDMTDILELTGFDNDYWKCQTFHVRMLVMNRSYVVRVKSSRTHVLKCFLLTPYLPITGIEHLTWFVICHAIK